MGNVITEIDDIDDVVLVAPCGFAKAKIDYAKAECFFTKQL